MPIAEPSLVRIDQKEVLTLEGVDVSGDWNTVLLPRVQTQLSSHILDWVRRQPGGSTILRCWQCGSCTAGCCLHLDLGMEEFNPRQFLYLAQTGQEEELRSEAGTIWRCVSCHRCVDRCPKGVRVEEVLHTIRAYLVASGQAPESPADRFDRAFTENLLRHGILDAAALFRAYERREGRRTPLRSQFRTGLELLLTGRLRTGLFARRTSGWTRMGPVLRRELAADVEARRRAALRAPLPGPGAP